MLNRRRPSLPPGRISLRDLCERVGVSRTVFFAQYRFDPSWVERLDLKVTASGILHFRESAAEELRRALEGERPVGRSPRANNLGHHARKGAAHPLRRGAGTALARRAVPGRDR